MCWHVLAHPKGSTYLVDEVTVTWKYTGGRGGGGSSNVFITNNWKNCKVFLEPANFDITKLRLREYVFCQDTVRS